MSEYLKTVENIFFTVTCFSVITCTIRADYNFAMALLFYFLIKNARGSKIKDTAIQVSLTYKTWGNIIL